MRIFLSFASEQAELANEIRLKLQDEGYDVFFSAADIHAGEGYDARIRKEMAASERLLFLASPASLAEGCYTQTELALAEERWPKPRGNVMAVMVDGVGGGDLPPYLGAVGSAVEPKGSASSHVTATVIQRWPRTLRRFLKPTLWALAIGGLLALGVLWYVDKEARETRDAEEAYRLQRLTPEAFRPVLTKFRQAEESGIESKSRLMVDGLARMLANSSLVPTPTAAPPEELSSDPAKRLEQLAGWAYPKGETREERVAERRRLVSVAVLPAVVKMLGGRAYTMANDDKHFGDYRAPTMEGGLREWYIGTWTRPLDPADPFDLREGNRLLTGTPHEDGPHDWPAEPTPKLLLLTRIIKEGLEANDHAAQSLVLVAAVADQLKFRGWTADHPIGKAYEDAQTMASENVTALWGLTRADSHTYVMNAYKRDYQKAP